MHYKPYLAGIGFSTIFGLSFMVVRGALEHIDPFHLLGLRFAVAAAVLALLRLVGLIRFKISLADIKALLPLLLLMPVLYFPGETIGIQLTSASQAGIIMAVIPIFVAILSALLLKEYPSRIQWLFILISVGGVIFMVIMEGRGTVGTASPGIPVLLGTVLAGACYHIASRHAARKYSPLQLTWAMMATGALVFNGIALIQHAAAGRVNHYFQPLLHIWPVILYLGVLSSVVAFFLINYSLSRITATQSAIFSNLETVIAMAAGVFLLHEELSWFHLLGAALILAGVWGTNRFAPTAENRTAGQEQPALTSD
ncbi:MAG TPA: DMT family transporter [Bacillota bacterium]|nr:DMT family transporter [Bacillota bacterium]